MSNLVELDGNNTNEPITQNVVAEDEEILVVPDEPQMVQEPEQETSAKKKKKLEDMTPMEQIELHVQRNTYSVQVAKEQDKKSLYASQHVFVEDGDDFEVETESIQRKQEYMELVASSKDHRILKGVITSVTEVDSNKKEDVDYIPNFMAKVRFGTGQFNVNIPSFVLYYYNYKNMNRAMAMDIQKNMMRRIGAEIEFVCQFVDEKTGVAYGDRLMALSMRGVRNYTSINGLRPRITPGELVQAKIIAVAREYITVDAAGAEMRIPLEEISHLYVSDAREFDGIKTPECYKVGNKVVVKILTVDTQKVSTGKESYTLIMATASIKQAKPNPRLKYFDEFKPGDIYAGVITGITETGVYVVLDNKMDCLCKFPTSGNMPILGDNVIVRINSKDEEKKFIYGTLR